MMDSADLDKKFCRSITVALGCAASAGANLLAFGDYAYAYDHSLIHFHGVRTSELPEKFEDAAHLLQELEITQRDISIKLAKHLITRVIFRYQRLEANFKTKRRDVPDKELIALKCFTDAIRPRISRSARRIVTSTFVNVQQARDLSRKVMSSVKFGKRTNLLKQDSKVLIELIKHEVSDPETKPVRLDESGISRIMGDYFLLRDYHMGEHVDFMQDLVDIWGEDFLTPKETVRLKALGGKTTKEGRKLLYEKAGPRITPLWYYTVSLCRNLFRGENRLTATDAYWLGLIDEVIGTQLEGFRAVAEKAAQKAQQSNPQPSQTASSSPPQVFPQATPASQSTQSPDPIRTAKT